MPTCKPLKMAPLRLALDLSNLPALPRVIVWIGIAKLLFLDFKVLMFGRSRHHFGGVVGPEAERVVTSVAV